VSERGWVGLVIVMIMAGCGEGDEPLPPLEPPAPVFARVCGTAGPHRLLPLAPGEHAYRIDRRALSS